MTTKGMAIDLKTIAIIVTFCGMIFSAGVAWSSLDIQLGYVTAELAEIKANQKAMNNKLSALVVTDGRLDERVGHVEEGIKRVAP